MPIAHVLDLQTLRITAEESFHHGTIFQASLMQGTTLVPLQLIKQDRNQFYYQLDYQPGLPYRLKVNNGFDTPIVHQLWLHTKEFETLFHYEGPLGAEYTPAQTTFRVWAPTATAVELRVFDDPVHIHFMTREDRGVFSLSLPGDLNGVEYLYVAHVEGQLREAIDPYAWMNAHNSTRSVVVDPNELTNDVYQDLPVPRSQPTSNVIYELHVRDYSVFGAQVPQRQVHRV
jgi:pullulanase